MALFLILGVGQDLSEAHLAGPQAILLIWLLIGGAGPLCSRCPVTGWVRTGAGLGGEGDQPALRAQRCSRRFRAPRSGRASISRASRSPVGTGIAAWPVPLTGELVTAPWRLLLLCWALLFGVATRPVAVLLERVGAANPPLRHRTRPV